MRIHEYAQKKVPHLLLCVVNQPNTQRVYMLKLWKKLQAAGQFNKTLCQ